MTDQHESLPPIQGLQPKEAWELLQADPRAVLIDVRSSMEFLFVGHAKGSVHISWIDEPDWKVNAHFAQDVRRVMLGGVAAGREGGPAPVILICRSGHRSLEAGAALLEDGFEVVRFVEGGFEGPLDENHQRSSIAGWRHQQLPWEQC